MTIQEALAWGRAALAASPSPGLEARLLLAHILGVDHAYLVGHSQDTLPAAHQAAYAALVSRAQRHEPIPYLVGHAPFYGLDFLVSPAVLIPRPETEQLVEQALAWANTHRPGRIVDVGTGSGCIAITLARHLPQAQVIAIDLSSDALAIAQQNGARHAPGRVQFRHGSLLAPLHTPANLIIANLPYVTDAEWTLLDDGVKWYEPANALRGGPVPGQQPGKGAGQRQRDRCPAPGRLPALRRLRHGCGQGRRHVALHAGAPAASGACAARASMN